MNDDEIDLLTNDQLWAALCRRHKGLLLVWCDDETRSAQRTRIGWNGGYALGMGLAQYALSAFARSVGVVEEKDTGSLEA